MIQKTTTTTLTGVVLHRWPSDCNMNTLLLIGALGRKYKKQSCVRHVAVSRHKVHLQTSFLACLAL